MMIGRGWTAKSRSLRGLALAIAGGGVLVGFSGCSAGDEEKSPVDPLAAIKWEPSFEPDYVNLTPLPGVEAATKEEQDFAVVKDGVLEFPADRAPSVRHWQRGKIVAAAPGQGGAGRNPFGYARRVLEVTESDGVIRVTTEALGLQDLVEGEFQVRGDDEGVNIDLANLDPQWVAEHLYGQTIPLDIPEGVYGLKDDPALSEVPDASTPPGNGFCCSSVTKAVSSAASSAAGAVKSAASSAVTVVTNGVASAGGAVVGGIADGAYSIKERALDVTTAITPKSFEDSVALDSSLAWEKTTIPLFEDMEFKKTVKRGSLGIELFVKGKGAVTTSAHLNPGFQLGARIPNPVNRDAPPFKMWMNIDSRIQTEIGFQIDLEAGVSAVQVGESFFPQGTQDYLDKIEKNVNYAQEVYSANREHQTGDAQMKPEATFSKLLWMSSPKVKAFFAGPVPVAVTSTLQVNLVCGFEAKASVRGTMTWATARTFKFRVEYENGRVSVPTPPTGSDASTRDVQILGGGSVIAHCGLVPRVNAFAYDTMGMYTGIRGSLVASAKFESSCEGKETSSTPDGAVSLNLDANVGLQVGGRLQAPLSSFAKSDEYGWDTPPFEPFSKTFPLLEKKWEFKDGGLGYCLPSCTNGGRDARETDVDCGGGACGACGVGKRCNSTVDCAGDATCNAGVCSEQPCFNGVRDHGEAGVDCGGACALKCGVGQGCSSGADCTSTWCSRQSGRCVADSCSDGIRNGDETGVDCGGSCGKCATGTLCAVARDCASGFSNGTHCVATSCEDRVASGNETDRDCGGNNACHRCSPGMACLADGDCIAGLRCGANRRCEAIPAPTCDDRIRNQDEADVDCGGSCATKCSPGRRCGVAGDCASSLCADGTCRPPSCNDNVKNGDESGRDCGGASACARCDAGQTCTVHSDCQSNVCLPGGVCGGAFTVGGTIDGLAPGGSVVLVHNGASRSLDQNGAFTFGNAVGQSAPYAVTVSGQPTGQTCAVQNGSGTMQAANVTDVAVVCTSRSYTLGGTVSGLVGSVTLRNDGGNDHTVSQDGVFSFPAQVPYLGTIAVAVAAQPTGQACTVTGGNGTMGAADRDTVSITCTSNAYTVGGTVSGLKGNIVLRNNGGGDLPVNQDGVFAFGAAATVGTPYAVTVQANPAGQTCSVSNGTGTVAGAHVTNIGVTCTDNPYTVGGTVAGLSGTVVLTNNGGDDRTIAQSSAFTFSSSVAFSQPYAVAVKTQPATQTCVVARGAGTMGAGNVTNVEVTCTTNTFTIGGTVSGLSGSSPVVLVNNGGNNASVQGNGPFSFSQSMDQGSAYAVTVLNHPIGKTCSVTNGTGTVNGNVTNVSVNCTDIPYTIGGNVSGLAGGTVVLRNNGGDELGRSDNGPFVFGQPLTHNATYSVSIQTQPAGQICSLVNASGTATGNVTNVGVNCGSNAFTVGGNVTGLAGTLVLRNNGGNDLSLSTSGPFTFSESVPLGNPYAVTVATQPPRRSCTVTNGSGTIGGSNVTNVSIACAPSERLAFVTNTTFNGSFSGVFGADARCQTAANNAALGGTYHAWIADTGSSGPLQRFVQSTVPYVRVDGLQVATSFAALTGGTLQNPINLTELGTTYDGPVWTATLPDGTFTGSHACVGWTAFVSNQYGGQGLSSSTTSAWTSSGFSACNVSSALYCFEQ